MASPRARDRRRRRGVRGVGDPAADADRRRVRVPAALWGRRRARTSRGWTCCGRTPRPGSWPSRSIARCCCRGAIPGSAPWSSRSRPSASCAALLRAPRMLGIVCLAFAPYAVFHLLLQETATIRYALPLLVPIVWLATWAHGAGAPRRRRVVGRRRPCRRSSFRRPPRSTTDSRRTPRSGPSST